MCQPTGGPWRVRGPARVQPHGLWGHCVVDTSGQGWRDTIDRSLGGIWWQGTLATGADWQIGEQWARVKIGSFQTLCRLTVTALLEMSIRKKWRKCVRHHMTHNGAKMTPQYFFYLHIHFITFLSVIWDLSIVREWHIQCDTLLLSKKLPSHPTINDFF